MNDYVEIGYIKKSFGVDGQLRFSLFDKYDFDLIEKEFIFLDFNGSMVPFLVTGIDDEKSVLRLEWIVNLEEANKYANHSMYMKADKLPMEEKSSSPYQGFELLDSSRNLIGLVTSINEFPGQDMIIVRSGDKEHLIPFHEDLLIEVSDSKIIYNIPDGVLDL